MEGNAKRETQKNKLKESGKSMSTVFTNKAETIEMVSGAYKKLKSHLYYDKTLVFAKKRLAEFESNRELFYFSLENIASNLLCENTKYFEDLIDQISFRVLPKKFKSRYEGSDVIQASIDHNSGISKVNFFIDMPIELYIIDFLWTIQIGKIISNYPFLLSNSGATAFKRSLFTLPNDLISGVDYKSNRAFKPYFDLYVSWRNNAFKAIKRNHTKNDSLLICLDLKSFYYSVDFDFDKLSTMLCDDQRLEQLSFLTCIIKNVYFTYTKLIIKYKKGVVVKKNNCIFPIGITSASILREIYLYQFDKQIIDTLSPKYYKRYVDDILIVLNADKSNEMSSEEIINKYFINTGLVQKSGAKDFKFVNYSNIKIQRDKVNCFCFPKGQRIIMLDLYEEVINANTSETNLLPDTDMINLSFTSAAYNIQNLDISNKIRELGFLRNNNYNATKFINSLLRLIKNATISKDDMNIYFNQIEEFYKGSQSLEYSNNWRSLFELYLICGEIDRTRAFYRSIINEIEKASFELLEDDELLEKRKNTLLRHLKNDLKKKLKIVAAQTTALNYQFGRTKKIKELAIQFRESNMLNHSMVAYPLLNYSNAQRIALTEQSATILFNNLSNGFALDEFKLEWTPRYINAIEFQIFDYIKSVIYDQPNFEIESAHEQYISFNNLGEYAKDVFRTKKVGENPMCVEISYNIYGSDVPKIALVNTNISLDDAANALFEPKRNLTLAAKTRLFKILNIAKTQKVDYLVFPEYYFPLTWLLDISLFAMKNHITIITGLQYLTINGQAHNIVCNFVPAITGKNFNTGFVLFREKNYYAPDEIIEVNKTKNKCKDRPIPFYYRLNNGIYEYSTILCYEFTDISSRASMKSKIELLFVPQLNKDTNYFSAIVESTSRDLHCFVIQANTSAYGDSRITAPYKTESKNILQIKGGETDVVMIASVNISELYDKREHFLEDVYRIADICYNCKKNLPLGKNKAICDECSNKLKKGKIKGTPPNF